MKEVKNMKKECLIDFLMTYGWAVLIILLVAGALVYYEFFAPPMTTDTLNCTQPQQYLNDYYNATQIAQNSSVQVYVKCQKEMYSVTNNQEGCRCYLLRDFQNWTLVVNDEFWGGLKWIK